MSESLIGGRIPRNSNNTNEPSSKPIPPGGDQTDSIKTNRKQTLFPADLLLCTTEPDVSILTHPGSSWSGCCGKDFLREELPRFPPVQYRTCFTSYSECRLDDSARQMTSDACSAHGRLQWKAVIARLVSKQTSRKGTLQYPSMVLHRERKQYLFIDQGSGTNSKLR